MKKILPLFSYLFHPIFIPLLGTFFYVVLDDAYFTLPQYLVLFIQIIIISILLPLAFFYLLRTFGKIDSIMLSDISQRKIPLLLQIMLMSILIAKSITINRYFELFFFFAGGLCSTIIAFMLLFAKIKASIHMIGISALTVFIIGLSIHTEINIINTVVFFVVMNGFVASSRLEMNAHTKKELALGFVCGMLPQVLLLYYWV